jgi:ATP-binding cassette subfamily B protein
MPRAVEGAGEDWRFITGLVRPRRRGLLWVLCLLTLTNLLSLVQPLFLQLMIDRAVPGGRTDLILVLSGAMLLTILLGFGAGTLHRAAFTRLSARILLDLRLRFLRHLQRLSLRWFAATPFGEILSRFNRDAAAVQDLATGAFLSLATAAVNLVLVLGFMAAYDLKLLAIGASPFPLALLAAWLAAPRLRAATQEMRDRSSETASFFTETMAAMRAVQAAGRETSERRRFVGLHRRAMASLLRFQLTSQVAGGLASALVASGGVALLAVGARWAAQGRISPGVLAAEWLYLTKAYSPLRGLLELYLKFQEGHVSIARLRDYLSIQPEVRSGKSPLPCPLRGEIRFQEVTFSHRSGQPILRGASFTVEPGSVTALVGLSGIGKTTTIDLMMRFYDPEAGAVLLDGVDLRELPLPAYRRRIALAAQEPFIFRGSLFENVAFGRRGATREEARSALSWARLDGLLERLPGGLDSLLGEAGARVSGGERQRIALARAVLCRPRILILDEATSALDGLTERDIREALHRLRSEGYPREIAGKEPEPAGPVTVVLVTHRLPAVGFADRILVLDGGAVRESGTHGELLSRSGLYRRMFEAIGSAPRRAEAAG